MMMPVHKQRSKAGSRSFLSNQDLLEGIRNKSAHNSQVHGHGLKSQPSQVTLIPHKQSFRSKPARENDPLAINRQTSAVQSKTSKPKKEEKASRLIEECLKMGLGRKEEALRGRLERALRVVVSLEEREQGRAREEEEYREEVGRLVREKGEIMKEKQGAERRAQSYRARLRAVKREGESSMMVGVGDKGLEQIIVSQSEVIDRQSQEHQQQQGQMRRMLVLQAQQLELTMKDRSALKRKQEEMEYLSLLE